MKQPTETARKALKRLERKEAVYWEKQYIGRVVLDKVEATDTAVHLSVVAKPSPGLDRKPREWSAGGRWEFVSISPLTLTMSGYINWAIFLNPGIVRDVTRIAAIGFARRGSAGYHIKLRYYLMLCHRMRGQRPVFWPDLESAIWGVRVS